jgi:integrase
LKNVEAEAFGTHQGTHFMKFTDRYIDKIKPREKRFEILESNGFTLTVYPTGVKTFFYLYKSDGKNRRLKLGRYPHCSLSEARKRHREALDQRHEGEDPAEEKRRRRQETLCAPTVEELSDAYIERHARPNKKSWEKDRYILDKDVIPAWGTRKASEIRKRDVILLLEKIVERGSPNQSGQVLKIVRRMFNFAVERDVLEASPCHLVKPLSPGVAKDRALSKEEIAAFWSVLDVTRMAGEMKRGLRLILVTGQRPGEVFGMHRRELRGNWWTIPTERAKNKREHSVWLSPLALDLIGAKKGYILGEMQKDAPARAVRRLVAPQGREKAIRLKIPPFTPHDLRRTCATHLGGLGYSNEQIGRLLNHVEGTVTAIYNRHRYEDLIKEMALAWEERLKDYLSALRL